MPMVLKVKEGGIVRIGDDIVIAYRRRSAGVLHLAVEAPADRRITNEAGEAIPRGTSDPD